MQRRLEVRLIARTTYSSIIKRAIQLVTSFKQPKIIENLETEKVYLVPNLLEKVTSHQMKS